MFRRYYLLTKPGIIYSNTIVTLAGFFLASKGYINILLLIATLIGTACVIASACVFNNYFDRDIDATMSRTKKRPLVTKTIPIRNALIFASFLILVGIGLLWKFTNILTVSLGIIGFIDYVALYTFSKKRTEVATVIGSISGAVPPVAGYTAVTNRIDLGAVLLFLVLVVWQMPHFYAIAIFRIKDYAAAHIPILPITKGVAATKTQMVVYILGFIIVTFLFSYFRITGHVFAIVVGIVGLIWLILGIQGFSTKNDSKWARKMFFVSLLVVLMLSLMLCLNAWLA